MNDYVHTDAGRKDWYDRHDDAMLNGLNDSLVRALAVCHDTAGEGITYANVCWNLNLFNCNNPPKRYHCYLGCHDLTKFLRSNGYANSMYRWYDKPLTVGELAAEQADKSPVLVVASERPGWDDYTGDGLTATCLHNGIVWDLSDKRQLFANAVWTKT